MSSLRFRGFAGAFFCALAVVLGLGTASQAATLRAVAGDGMIASLTDEQDLYLDVAPLKGEGLLAFTRRLTGDAAASRTISRENGRVKHLQAGVRYRVPYQILLEEHKLKVISALFVADRKLAAGWEHAVKAPGHGRSLWRIAEWFTGEGRNFGVIRDHNGLSDDALQPGQVLVIPAALLLPVFRGLLPTAQASYLLDYVRAGDGQDYGVYHLAAGEALYSSVVVRFTGRTFAEDVNAYAAELARLNGIPDVTDMPVGQPIRIPFDQLLPEYLPAEHPRRAEYEKARTESERYSNTVQASRLEGITVILDPGHGGQDPGAMRSGVWESVYVYDIALRIKSLLETTTAAKVVPTVRDGASFRVIDRDVLPRSRGHAVLTQPHYPIAEAKTGVNLRWYLANSVFAKAVKQGGEDGKVVFLSIHADSLHSSLRGAMAYIPAAALTQGEFGRSGAVYASRKEFKERPRVSFNWKERTRSEGLSRQLADRLIASFRQGGLAVHPEKPVRDRIVRSRRWTFVPAVIRYNAVPAKLLLEVCNLNNDEDRRLLQTRSFREKVARAVVDGILGYYGQATEARMARTSP